MRWFSLIHAGSHVSCTTLESSSLNSLFRLRDFYPVSCNFPVIFSYNLPYYFEVLTPKVFLLLVWALAISLATTLAIIIIFSSFSYLDVSVHWVPLITLCIHVMITRHNPCCVSTFGYLRINVYVQLPVDYRSLSRPSSALSAKASTICSL